jgi:eukaryotic-like serine/threonine-protein kinase
VPPDVIAGRYRVEREVGRGGMGSVWLCRDERLGRPVAVKQVGGLPGESSLHLARALREARHSAALNHPNVVAIFDALEEGDHVWLVMEYVPSRTLDQMVREDGPLAPRHAAGIGADVADGLAAAHALGVVHRDVKPSNILVRGRDNQALIADFGIARTVGQEQLTRSGLVTGTPAYFAPELARGEEPSPASDVWALGVSLYVAVEGEPPYAEQANAIAMLNTIASEPPPAPTRAGPLAPVMQHMLDLDPETRWTMARSAAALRELAIAEAVPVLPVDDPAPPTPVRGDLPPDDRPPDTVPTRAVRPGSAPRRQRALVAIAASVAVALVALGGWWSTRDPGADPNADRPGAGVRRTPTKPASSSPPATRSGGASSPASSASSASSSSSASNPAPSSSASSSAPAPGGAEADSPADLVADYYGLLPEDTGTAWDLLTPELQDQIGEGTFEGFWATIDDVRVDDTEEVGDGLVEVTLTYVTDGRSEQETRQLAVARVGDAFLISDDMGAV